MRSGLLSRRVTSSLAGCLFAACSSSGDGGASPTQATTPESFAQQLCDLQGSCCQKQGKAPDTAKCIARVNAKGTYDAAAGAKCLDVLRARPTYCDDGEEGTGDPACKPVFTSPAGGTKKPGELCDLASDCAASSEGGVDCNTTFANGATSKKCQLQIRAKEGDACGGDRGKGDSFVLAIDDTTADRIAACWEEDGLYCASDTKKCTQRIAAGGACKTFDSRACASGSRCDFDTQACVALLGAGAACTPSATSFDSPCADGFYCDDSAKKCMAVRPTGAACTKELECRARACTNGKCGTASAVFLCAP